MFWSKPPDKITSRSVGEDGKEKITREHFDRPLDISNGLIQTLLLNIDSDTPEVKVTMVAPTAKPRLIHLSIRPQGEQAFSVGRVRHKAMDFLIKIEPGAVAPLIGKEPADLTFNRQRDVRGQAFISALLDSVLVLYQGRLAGSKTVIERRYQNTASFTCYPGELRQVFANLIGNVFDATRNGGRSLCVSGQECSQRPDNTGYELPSLTMATASVRK